MSPFFYIHSWLWFNPMAPSVIRQKELHGAGSGAPCTVDVHCILQLTLCCKNHNWRYWLCNHLDNSVNSECDRHGLIKASGSAILVLLIVLIGELSTPVMA